MNETPYELLLRKQKQRKAKLLNNIDNRDFKRRTASYSLKFTKDPDQESQPLRLKQKIKMNFSNNIKKSYLCRKFLNKTSQGNMTSEQFNKFKERMLRVNNCEATPDKQKNMFKQLWEKQNFSKQLKEQYQRQSLQIIIPSSQEIQKSKKISGQRPIMVKKNSGQKQERVENISQIAEKRKMSLDFDLEVMGNKKNIRIKDVSTSKAPLRKKIIKQNSEVYIDSQFSEGNFAHSLQKDHTEDDKKAPSSFFKRLQEQIFQGLQGVSEDQIGLVGTKIKYDWNRMHDLSQGNEWPFERSNTTEYRPHMLDNRTINTPYQLRKEIKNSWNPQTANRHDLKAETSHERRYPIKRTHQRPLPKFINDIHGWVVNKDNEDQENYLFEETQ